MQIYTLTLCLIVFVFSVSGEPQKKNRVHDPELSDHDHHKDDDDHDVNYDHDAFLGKDEASKYKDLTPEESKERLGKIFDKMDTNKDGKISSDELKHWITHTTQKYLRDDTDRNWKDYDTKDDKLTFEAYKNHNYKDNDDVEGLARDERRWAKADQDGDKVLSKEEFFNFLHPEESDHMKEVIVQETLDEIDKDKDGFIDLKEYISDMWTPDKSDEKEPDWIQSERESFEKQRDKNKDGKLDHAEIQDWVLPNDHSHVESETKHLMEQADGDKDGFLTKEEVLDKYDVFVGSQATDYGEALNKHEEL